MNKEKQLRVLFKLYKAYSKERFSQLGMSDSYIDNYPDTYIRHRDKANKCFDKFTEYSEKYGVTL